MIVKCTQCSQDLKLADEQVSPEGTRILCPRCRTIFVARPDGATAPDVQETAGDDPDAGFRLPVEDQPRATAPAAPTPAEREDVRHGRPAQVDASDEGDFDILAQLGLSGSDSVEGPHDELELTLEDDEPAPLAPPPRPPVAPPAPPPQPRASVSFDLSDDGDDTFELEDETFDMEVAGSAGDLSDDPESFKLDMDEGGFSPTDYDYASAGSSPGALGSGRRPEGEETAFDLPPISSGAERERSLDDIFAEDEPTGGGGDSAGAPELPPLRGGVEPGGEISGTIGSPPPATGPAARPASAPGSHAQPSGRTAAAPPPRAAPSEGARAPGWLVGLIVLLIVGGAGGAWLVTSNGDGHLLERLQKELRGLTSDTGPPAPTLPGLTLESVVGGREVARDGVVYAIRGRVRNPLGGVPAYVISVQAELLNGDGEIVGRSASFAGNDIPAAALAELGMEEVRARLDREIGNGGDNVRVQPGDSLPFLIVLDGIPSGPLSYRLEATSRLPDDFDPPAAVAD